LLHKGSGEKSGPLYPPAYHLQNSVFSVGDAGIEPATSAV
jgi:hypothetical protein